MSDALGVLVVGSLNRDYILRVARRPDPGETVGGAELALFCGGKGANQAVAASRMGASVVLLGCVGDDEAGRALRACVQGAGVDADAVETVGSTTSGSAFITVTADGENAIAVAAGANAAVNAAWVRRHSNHIAAAAVVLVQLEIPLEGACEAILLANAKTTVICNPSPPRLLPSPVMRRIDVFVVNASEAAWFAAASPRFATPPSAALGVTDQASGGTDEASGHRSTVGDDSGLVLARQLRAQGPSVVILTLGSRGAIVASGEGTWHVEAPQVSAIDTTGAGDAFTGALAAALWAQRPLLDAVTDAVIAGSITTTRRGAQASLPEEREVRASPSPRMRRLD